MYRLGQNFLPTYFFFSIKIHEKPNFIKFELNLKFNTNLFQ